MDIIKIKSIILNDFDRRRQILSEKRYYTNDNQIKDKGITTGDNEDPIRTADNRISHNFHQ